MAMSPHHDDLVVGVRADTASVLVSQDGSSAPLPPLSMDAAAELSALLHRASVKVHDLAVAHERYQQALADAEAEFAAVAEGVRA